MRRPQAPTGWRWAILILLVLILGTTFALLGLDIASLVGLREVQSDALTEGDLPPPPPTCNCCIKCATALAYQCPCCSLCPSCNGHISAAVQTVTENIVTRTEAGGSIPPDTTMAVGNDDNSGRILAVVNTAVVILNKATHTRISSTVNFYAGGVRGGDPWVTWDPISSRFFLTAFAVTGCRAGLVIGSPANISGDYCSGNALFGPQTFNVNGPVVAASPFDGCATITTNLTGKIALMQRNACLYAAMVKRAQDAGAIGVIIYRNTDSLVTMAGSDPSIVIPSVFIGVTNGQKILANLPATATLRSTSNVSYSTEMYISVSNTSAPNTRDDFAHYVVKDGLYATQFADYPKHSTSVDALFISTQNFGNESAGISPCIGPNIRAFNKTALMVGAGAQTLWSQVVPGGGVTGPIFLFPAETRTPISDQSLPSVFVGLGTGNALGFCDIVTFQRTPATSLQIRTANAIGLTSYVGVVPLPTPMDFGVCYPSPANVSCIVQPLARQPPPTVPYGPENLMGFVTTAVVYEGLLYTAITHNISDVHSVVRWFIIDVSPAAVGLQPILLQWGDLNIDANIDTWLPKIDVAEDGTMGIGFYASGPNQPIVASYTVRLDSDAPNSIRTPFHTAVPNVHTYFEDFGSRRNRYGDYFGLQVDPVDRETFYGYAQRPSRTGVFNPPGQLGPCLNLTNCVAREWTTDLFTFRVDVNECPTDGQESVSRVLPSTSPQTGAPPVIGPAADRNAFALPLADNECIQAGQRRPSLCT